MARFPKIQSPCPYKSDLAAVMDGDFCRMCERRVVDLTAWSDDERVAFLAGCSDEVCVSYRLPVRGMLAAAALASAAAVPTAAMAEQGLEAVTLMPAMAAAAREHMVSEVDIIVGGIKDPANAVFVDYQSDDSVPELPVVYEEAPAPAAAPISRQGAPI